MEAPVLNRLEELSVEELRALTAAAAWYAKRHEGMIAKSADDASASAVSERERYLDLHAALWKLGIRLRLPDGISLRNGVSQCDLRPTATEVCRD